MLRGLNIQDRIANLKRRIDTSLITEGIIGHPGEVLWWLIEGPTERRKAYYSQWRRMRRKNGYFKTPKGKAELARSHAKRREHSTDPNLYAARVELLHILQEPCAKCHTPYRITHQVDHILALCLGGTDDWSNLHPLCAECHRKKSIEDRHKFVTQNAGVILVTVANTPDAYYV